MMKVVFITIHVGSNFGSNLQTIATSEVLKLKGCTPLCLNYIPPRTTWNRYWHGYKSLYSLMRRIMYSPFCLFEKKRFSRYLSRYCVVSKPIYNEDDFINSCPKADVYITGSDQVWNFIHNEGLDTHYFFYGIKGKKIAYASSIGMKDLTEKEKEILNLYTKDYTAISVRESSAVELFQQFGRSVTHVIDPTLMLNYQDWAKYAKKRLVKERYVFVYFPYNVADEEMCYSSVKKIANLNNLKIVSYSCSFFNDKHADKTILFADPGDFLSLMINADYVVTNSFHGTAFSINLHKPFIVHKPSHFSTRITSLLTLCGLESRLLDAVVDEREIDYSFDYNTVEGILNREREKALEFLDNALK